MKTKEKIICGVVAAILLALAIIVNTNDAEYELRATTNDPVTSCSAYTRTCFTR